MAIVKSVNGDLDGARLLKSQKSLAGLVSYDTSIGTLFFEVVGNSGDLEEGRLVEAQIGREPLLYQIVNGLTKDEIVHQKNSYGYARAQGQKIGEWDIQDKRFDRQNGYQKSTRQYS